MDFSLIIGTTGSDVPHKSLKQDRATFMPDAAQAVNRFLLNSSRSTARTSVLMLTLQFRHLNSGSLALVFLTPTCRDLCLDFSSTLPTMALYQCSLRWFGTCSCKPAPRDLSSSLAQLRTLYIKVRSWRTSSSPGEFHPQALTDPYMNLSIHTAPLIQSISTIDFALVKGSSHLWLTKS